jgi:hypothetical protein
MAASNVRSASGRSSTKDTKDTKVNSTAQRTATKRRVRSYVPYLPYLPYPPYVLVVSFVFLLGSSTALAQQQPDPVAEAPIRLGVVGLAPRFSITNLGVDTNVFNSVTDSQRDFTFTGSPSLDLFMRTQRGLLSVSGRVEFVYFNKFDSERAVNGGGSAQYEYRFNRVRPFVRFGGLNTRERPGYEIDVRARRVETDLETGVDLRVASKSYVALSGRRRQVDYDGDAVFGGRPLNQALNRTLEAVDLTWRQNLTVLTTWVLRASGERERFEFDERRNGDSARVTTGFELGRFALIRGNAFVGYRRLVGAEGGTLPEFSGVTADVDVSYTAPSQTRLALGVNRDVEYSFEIATPYYVQTGWTATLTQRITGRWDVQLTGGRDRLAYQASDPTPQAPGPGVVADRLDRIDRVGGGMGYTFGEDMRLGFDVISYQRQSDVIGRDYRTLRAGASVTYGF